MGEETMAVHMMIRVAQVGRRDRESGSSKCVDGVSACMAQRRRRLPTDTARTTDDELNEKNVQSVKARWGYKDVYHLDTPRESSE